MAMVPEPSIALEPIGVVHTPFERRADAPRQGFLGDARGVIDLEPAYEAGLDGLEPGDEVVVIWYADRADRSTLEIELGGHRGVFASRSNDRPNPICLTTCEVLGVDGNRLEVRGVDMLDGSPVLDLKSTLPCDGV